MSSEKSEAEVVGRDHCPFCGAEVQVCRVRKKPNRLYIMCDGTLDKLACGSRMFLGARPSLERLRSAAAPAHQPAAPPVPPIEPAALPYSAACPATDSP